MYYQWTEWLLFFFFYCLAGWVWESCYVSVHKGKWVNRGFLHGPWLPIYGFGAVTILWVTLPVEDNIVLTYLFGMVGATILEYITGAAMEALFHVRYWDYSDKPLNLNGHICLGVSLGWGVFSVLLVRVIHQPVAEIVTQMPEGIVLAVDIVLLVLFAVDTVDSVRIALDFRKLLEKIEENSIRIQELERKIQEATKDAVAITQRTSERQKQRLEEGRELFAEEKQRLTEELQRFTGDRQHLAEESRARLQELKNSILLRQEEFQNERSKRTHRMRSMLRRNPSAVISARYFKSMNQIREWMKSREEEEDISKRKDL